MNDAHDLTATTTAVDADIARARESARISEANDSLPRPYAGTQVTVILPPSDTISADYIEMGYAGQWRLGGDLEGVVVYEDGEILAGDIDFAGPQGARRWAAALLSAAELSESAAGPAGRRCRVCGCTDSAACDTMTGLCAWRITYDDETGICTACQVPTTPPNA